MSVLWHDSLESVVKRICEQSQALAWAHNAASGWCQKWDTRIAISSIVLGIFAGTGAVANTTLLPFEGNTTLVGVVSLLTSTIQAINNKLAFAKRAESHRMASLAYSQIYNKLQIQLSLPRNERIAAQELLNWITTETERLTEIEPGFPANVKLEFHKKFGNMEKYSMPLTLNGLQSIEIIKSSETPGFKPTVAKTSDVKISIEV